MEPLAAARESGLVPAAEPLLVLLSGGADSICLLDVCVRLGARVAVLHVNHGLRPEAEGDEALCHELCARLGLELTVGRSTATSRPPTLPPTRPRPCSTAWPSRRDGARCSGCSRAEDGSCARCSRRPAPRRAPTARAAASPGGRIPPTRTRGTLGPACGTSCSPFCGTSTLPRSARSPRQRCSCATSTRCWRARSTRRSSSSAGQGCRCPRCATCPRDSVGSCCGGRRGGAPGGAQPPPRAEPPPPPP